MLQGGPGGRYQRVGAAEHAPRGPFYLLERRHALAEIAERGAVVPAEGLAVNPPRPERDYSILYDTLHTAARCGPVGRRRRRML